MKAASVEYREQLISLRGGPQWRPILMSAAMASAAHEGKKTQTRRIIELPKNATWEKFALDENGYPTYWLDDPDENLSVPQHYGFVGDKLWVREPWRVASWWEDRPMRFEFKDGTQAEENKTSFDFQDEYIEWMERMSIQSEEDCQKAGIITSDDEGFVIEGELPTRWRPSIFMPRWASRTGLEIANIRGERLQEININGCLAEGLGEATSRDAAILWFCGLWDSINIKRAPWSSNPWVWVIEFKRVQPA